MSRNNFKKIPYCKVCHDAGKPESEYKSHWVKDLNGNTLCPVLLNTECRYCFKLGHTAKFCDVLTKNKKEKERAERRSEAVHREMPKQKKKPTNGFAALQEDSDMEEEVKVSNKPNVIEEYPILGENLKKIETHQPEAKIGWAAIAAKPKVEEKSVIHIPTVKQEIKMKSWADWSDSDTEEEEDQINDRERDEGIYSDYDDDW